MWPLAAERLQSRVLPRVDRQGTLLSERLGTLATGKGSLLTVHTSMASEIKLAVERRRAAGKCAAILASSVLQLVILHSYASLLGKGALVSGTGKLALLVVRQKVNAQFLVATADGLTQCTRPGLQFAVR